MQWFVFRLFTPCIRAALHGASAGYEASHSLRAGWDHAHVSLDTRVRNSARAMESKVSQLMVSCQALEMYL